MVGYNYGPGRSATLYPIDVSVLNVTEQGSLPSERQARVDDALGQSSPRTEARRVENTLFQDAMRFHVESSLQDIVVFSDGLSGPVTEGRHDDFVLKQEVVAFLG